MKVLFLFCDMLRANTLRLFNHQVSCPKKLDLLMGHLGGTVFANCYTPAPDTGRSLACLYTGRLPKNNGCERRNHYPRYFLKPGIETLFDKLSKNQYRIITNVRDHYLRLGIIPNEHVHSHAEHHGNIHEFGKRLKNTLATDDRVFGFCALHDYHYCVDDHKDPDLAQKCGDERLTSLINVVLNYASPANFDFIVLFSDHGCKFKGERGSSDSITLIDDDRSRIVMFLHKKGESAITHETSLKSIIDVFPTMNQLLFPEIHEPSALSFDGESLFVDKSDRTLTIEDHSVFRAHKFLPHDIWAWKSNQHSYFESLDKTVFYEHTNGLRKPAIPDVNLVKQIQEALRAHTVSYSTRENTARYLWMLQYYAELDRTIPAYSDGTQRKKRRSWSRRIKSLVKIQTKRLKSAINRALRM